MAAGLVTGEGFAVDAIVIEAYASRYHGKALDALGGLGDPGGGRTRVKAEWSGWLSTYPTMRFNSPSQFSRAARFSAQNSC